MSRATTRTTIGHPPGHGLLRHPTMNRPRMRLPGSATGRSPEDDPRTTRATKTMNSTLRESPAVRAM